MAEASSREACVDRHKAYPFDIASRLGDLQRRRVVAMVAPVLPRDHVLDIGCNSGFLIDFLHPECVVCGVDAAPELVEKARGRLSHAEVADAESLPFPDDLFDVAVLGEIIEHVHDPVVVLREASRVARRLVVGSTPHEDGQWGPEGKNAPDGHRFHVRCYTADTLVDDLVAAGFWDYAITTVSKDGVRQFYVFKASVA